MSTFSGKIQEIPNISVDRFDGENFNSEVYFLSHCHTDHMRGLGLICFQQQLLKNNKYLYASQISCEILRRIYPDIKENLKELILNMPITILLKDNALSVTIIPAGHCPGSIMFLFEENDLRILYTGDYRITKNDIKKFNIFYDQFNMVKVIDKIYLDTTFFLKKYLHFPKREESLNELIHIIKEWTDRGNFFYINLITSAKYGYEYVFNEIFTKLNMAIHVGEDAFRFYSLIPEMDKCVTLDGTITRVHSSCNGFKQTCIYAQDSMIKSIKVSAFRWTQDDLTELGMSEFDSGVHYVCYSTHASYEEGSALIRFLKPKQIEICVKHDDPKINKEMMELIDEHLEEFTTQLKQEIQVPKLFKTENCHNKRKNRKSKDFSRVLNSPTRQRFNISKNVCSELQIVNDSQKELPIISELEKVEANVKINASSLKEKSFFDLKFGHSSTLSDDVNSVACVTNVCKSKSGSHDLKSLSKTNFIEVTYNKELVNNENETTNSSKVIQSKSEIDENNLDSILYNIIHSKPHTLSNTLETYETLDNKEEDEEASLLLDIIHFCPTNQKK